MDKPEVPLTVQETPEFAKNADRLLGDFVHAQLIAFLGLNPTSGVIVPATGGVRKLRWAVPANVAGRG